MSYEIDWHVGRALRFHRTRLKVSQQSLAAKSGIEAGRLRELEAGRAAFDGTSLKILAGGLGISVAVLIDVTQKAPPAFLAADDRWTAALVDRFLSDQRQLERNPIFKGFCRLFGLNKR